MSAVTACPSCGTAGDAPFYEQASVPMNSMLLLDDAAQARDFPRGPLSLCFCDACGFVWNRLYDAGSSEYSQRYEASQAFSGVFNKFATDLAQRWIDRYDIRNRTVLEIGCDKGDFLGLICELGDNRGIGIDPAATPERQAGQSDRLTFIADFYGEKYRDVVADVVICRHTLEHIAGVEEFMRQVRLALADRLDTVVLFELPDVLRVLKDLAFWDLYYEHCSYFSLGSLARLFRRTGFDVVRLERDFDDQYLLIEARPVAGDARAAELPEEDDLDDLRAAVENFRSTVGASTDRRRDDIVTTVEQGGTVVVWGGGSKGVAFLTSLGLDQQVHYAVDINPFKQGKYLSGGGQLVVGPEFLTELQPDVVIAMNPIYRDEIRSKLVELGVNAELQTV